MTRQSPYVITLSSVDPAVLEERSRAYTARFATVVRAKIVLLAADGEQNTKIAQRLSVHVDVVSTWRKRFFESALAGLDDRPGRGRPRSFTPEVVAEIKAMACEPPSQREVPLSRWSSAELAAQALAEGLVASMSASTVRRWLHEDAIKPWQHRSWIFPRDPDFAVKAARVLDLYQRIWQGTELGEDEYVISADEKSQLQALSRRHPELPPGSRTHSAGGVRVPPPRHPGLHRRLRRPPGPVDRPRRAQDRDRAVRCAGRARDATEPYASRSGCSGWSTTAPATPGSARSTGCDRPGRTRSWSTYRSTRLAQPDRDRLLHHPAQSHHACRLRRPGRPAPGSPRSSTATTPPPSRSTGASPAPT